jgi:hypothetical protein
VVVEVDQEMVHPVLQGEVEVEVVHHNLLLLAQLDSLVYLVKVTQVVVELHMHYPHKLLVVEEVEKAQLEPMVRQHKVVMEEMVIY